VAAQQPALIVLLAIPPIVLLAKLIIIWSAEIALPAQLVLLLANIKKLHAPRPLMLFAMLAIQLVPRALVTLGTSACVVVPRVAAPLVTTVRVVAVTGKGMACALDLPTLATLSAWLLLQPCVKLVITFQNGVTMDWTQRTLIIVSTALIPVPTNGGSWGILRKLQLI
jgi:hypothetical protein